MSASEYQPLVELIPELRELRDDLRAELNSLHKLSTVAGPWAQEAIKLQKSIEDAIPRVVAKLVRVNNVLAQFEPDDDDSQRE